MNKLKREDNKLYKITRPQAIERDSPHGYPECVLCGSNSPTDVHHIISRAQGGKSELNNLATLCRSCHNAAHGVKAKEIREKLLEIIRERMNMND